MALGTKRLLAAEFTGSTGILLTERVMQQWEYKSELLPTVDVTKLGQWDEKLNSCAADGWEVAFVTPIAINAINQPTRTAALYTLRPKAG